MKKIALITALSTLLSAASISDIKALYSAKEYQKSYTLAYEAFEENPSSSEINLLLAKSAMKLGYLNDALAALERILILDEDDDVARLELARLYFILEMTEPAKEAFELVLAHNPPKAVQANIQKYLSLIEKSKKPDLFHFGITFGMGYDTNKNSNPGENIYKEFLLSEYNIQDSDNVVVDDVKSDAYLEGSVNMNYLYDFGDKGGFQSSVGAFVYDQDYLKDDDFDMLFYSVNITPSYSYKSYKVALKLEGDGLNYAKKDIFQSYGSAIELENYFQSSSLGVTYRYKKRSYIEDLNRSVNINEVALRYNYYFSKEFMSLSSAYSKEAAITPSQLSFVNVDATQLGFSLRSKRLEVLNLSSGVLYKRSNYDDAISQKMGAEIREDRYTNIYLGLDRTFFKSVTLSARVSFTKNNSNYKPSQYTKRVAVVHLSYNY